MSHHSLLGPEFGDNILIGASSKAHLEENLLDLEKGPLPEEVVKVLDEAWALVKPIATKVRSLVAGVRLEVQELISSLSTGIELLGAPFLSTSYSMRSCCGFS